ncbi:MAG TPA: hypothetical protein VF761_09585 [Gemmatimonadaceae bacterium]
MSRVIRFAALAPLALLSLHACASGYVRPAALEASADLYASQARVRSRSDIIAPAELASAGTGTAYDVVQRLRPQFLAHRALGYLTDPYGGKPVVYYNGMCLGGIEELRTLSMFMVGEVRFLTPVAGSESFGRYHPGGVIAITSPR